MLTLNQTLGYYTPAFFEIYIASQNPVSIRGMTETELATFVHEYTHFIQDFTTLKGLQNIYNTFERLRYYVTETYKNRKIQIPVSLNNDILNLNQCIDSKAWGTYPCDELDRIECMDNIREEAVDLDEAILNRFPQLRDFRTVKAIADSPDGRRTEIEIGTLAVMESMAHLAEGLMGLPVTLSPDYPYNVVRIMADNLCRNAHLSDEILFALCDVALQCSIPGVGIYDMLSGIENGRFQTPNDGYDVYKIFPEAFREWRNNSYDAIVNMARNHLSELVQGPVGEQYMAWVDNIMDRTIDWRINHPDFLIDFIRQRDRYRDMVEMVGTPLMVNDAERYTKVPPVQFNNQNYPANMDVEFFRAIEYIMGLYERGQRRCPLRQWCETSGLLVDDDCNFNPPRHSDETRYHSLCPVGALWKHWDLGRYRLNTPCIFRPICN